MEAVKDNCRQTESRVLPNKPHESGCVEFKDNRPLTQTQGTLIKGIRSGAATLPVAQRKIYLDTVELGSEELLEAEIHRAVPKLPLLPAIPVTVSSAPFEFVPTSPDYIKELSTALWAEYGNKPNAHVMMRDIIDGINKVGTSGKIQIQIMTDAEFKGFRRGKDTRLSDPLKSEYAAFAVPAKDSDPMHLAKKEEVKVAREQLAKTYKTEADDNLSQGDYFKNVQKDSFRDLVVSLPESADFTLRDEVLAAVLAMKEHLTAAWYFNETGEKAVFDSGELISADVREEVKTPGTSIEKKTQDEDSQDNKTGRYFYSFIEHDASGFNTGTRFTKPATPTGTLSSLGGVKDGTGRRLRIKLSKMVKSGAMIMAGDLIADGVEYYKMGLDQNKTPQKLMASGTKTQDTDQMTDGLLENYVNFAFLRISIAKDEDAQIRDSTTNALTGYKAGEHALVQLRTLVDNYNTATTPADKTKAERELWEYLVRQVAQPQLMTPVRVSLGMKGIKMDKSPVPP